MTHLYVNKSDVHLWVYTQTYLGWKCVMLHLLIFLNHPTAAWSLQASGIQYSGTMVDMPLQAGFMFYKLKLFFTIFVAVLDSYLLLMLL